ncbi:MAG TPA: CPBP family intramembrane glutamic endopeptidase [Microlunatus sp.]|nr:CPBP family intramembrane glutamic endopeptidase [Microlunatus sp.]
MSTVVAVVPPLTRPGTLPFGLALYDSLGPVLASAVPAFVVVAAVGGRKGVRELASRCFRWRVGLRWYGFALFSVPVSVLLVSVAIFGPGLLGVVADRWLLILTTTLPHLLILIVFCIVAEEVGFLGFLQARWQHRFGPVAASALVAVPFADYHLPGTMVANGFGLAQFHVALAYVAVVGVLQLFGRVVIMWLYNVTGASVLLAGIWHASFDVTTTAFGHTFAVPGAGAGAAVAGFWIPSAIVVAFAVALLALTRGRLGDPAARRRETRPGLQ